MRLHALTFALMTFASLASAGGIAQADEPATATATVTATVTTPALYEGDPLFRYTTPYERYYLRAVLENMVVLGIGYTQYSMNKAGNMVDWDLKPGWSAIEAKLDFTALTFDNNAFFTNWFTHSLAGFLYYNTARTNRVSIPVAYSYAFLSSMLWEYVGEIREHAAINDLIVTPLSAVSLVEAPLQLGGLLQRGANAPVRTASWVFAPFKRAHDFFDHLEAEPATEVDSWGVPTDVWHHISVSGSAGVTHQNRGLTQNDSRVSLRSRIVSIPGYGKDGTRAGWFDSGEVSELDLRLSVAEGKMTDFNIATHVLPVGYAAQAVTRDAQGHLRGHGFYGGLHIGFEYGAHDYDRDRRQAAPNRIALVDGGLTLEQRAHLGALTLRARMDTLADFAGVEAYALAEERRENSDIHLVSILRLHNYYHSYGLTLRPRVEAELPPVDVGADLRANWFEAITVRDVEPASTNTHLDAADWRLGARAWIGFSPFDHLRTFVSFEHASRGGRVVESRASRSELGAYAGAEVVF